MSAYYIFFQFSLFFMEKVIYAVKFQDYDYTLGRGRWMEWEMF